MAGGAVFDIVFGSLTVFEEPADLYMAQGPVGLCKMACLAECLSLVAGLALVLLAVGIEAVRITVIQFMNCPQKIVPRMALATECFGLVAGSATPASQVGGELVLVFPSGIVYQ